MFKKKKRKKRGEYQRLYIPTLPAVPHEGGRKHEVKYQVLVELSSMKLTNRKKIRKIRKKERGGGGGNTDYYSYIRRPRLSG